MAMTTPTLLEAARHLRRRQTRAEQVLWAQVRAHRLMGLKFSRQVPVGPFILDFYCHSLRLAIEVDGGYHKEPDVASRDQERSLVLEGSGTMVLRFSNREVLEELDTVLSRILAVARERSDRQPSPRPTPEGGGSSDQGPSPRPTPEGGGSPHTDPPARLPPPLGEGGGRGPLRGSQ